MKKGVLLLVFVFTLILLTGLIHAEDVPGVPDFMQDKNVEDLNVNNLANTFNNGATNLRNLFESSPLTNVFVKVWDLVKPVFSFVLGVEAEVNWNFVFAVLLFAVLLVCLITIFTSILPFSTLISVIVSIVLCIVAGFFGIIKSISGFLAGITTNIYVLLIVVLVLITLIIILKMSEKQLRKQKEKLKEKMNKQKLESSVKVAEAFTKGITK